MVNRFKFSRELRLLTPEHFKNVFSKALKVSSNYLFIASSKNNLSHFRVGFAIAKKKIKRAHERNRIKRISREYFRLNQHNLPEIDFIIMANSEAQTVSNQILLNDLDILIQKILLKCNKNKNEYNS